jgi:hypothetical protein
VSTLGGVILPAVVTAVVGVLVMESYQTTPWLADKLMQWSVRLRYADNPERGKVRGEELTSVLEDLPTLFKLPTAGGFLLRALASRLANRRGRARREPAAVQRSLGARFRIALVKAGLAFVCAGTVFGIEFALADRVASVNTGQSILGGFGGIDWIIILLFGVTAGILAAIESVARPPKFYHGLIGGITLTLFLGVLGAMGILLVIGPSALLSGIAFSGIAFGVATALTCALTVKSKYIGVIISAWVNLAGVALTALANWLSSEWVANAVWFSGLGLALGVLAGFAAVVERAHREKYARGGSPVIVRGSRMRMIDAAPIPAVLADSLSGPDAVNPESSIPIGEAPRQE